VTFATTLATLWVGHRLLKIPMGLLAGMVAGIQTQPAALGFALEQSQDELPNIGYAAVFPIATITKIIAGQLIVAVLL
jgi:putative transport protein